MRTPTMRTMRMTTIAAVVALVGCGGGSARTGPTTTGAGSGAPAAARGPGFDLVMLEPDAAVEARVRADAEAGIARVEAFFGAPYRSAFDLRVLPDRAALDEHWAVAFGEPEFRSECWMVGMGTGYELSILTPARWRDQACEHDPDDPRELAGIVAHELVHTYHGQANRTIDEDTEKAEAIAWFVEGVAVLASGQLDDGRQAPAIDAIREGKAPARLADAWSGKYRYGVSGSLVAYLDATAGRAAIVQMLKATTPDELLAIAGMDEATLLERWRAWVTARAP